MRMSNGQGLTAESVFSVFPRALVEDPHVRALATAVAETLALHAGELTVLRIYSQIDSMPICEAEFATRSCPSRRSARR